MNFISNFIFSSFKKYGWLLLIFLTTTILYVNNVSDEFINSVDDGWGILQNNLVQNFNWETQRKIWLNDTYEIYYIPLTFTSFAIDIYLWGNNALYIKYENVFLFILSGFFLYRILKQLKIKECICLGVVAFFLLHPLQVESVAIASGRRQILNVLFQFISLYCFLLYLSNDHLRKYIYIGAIAFLFSFLSKPVSSFLVPFFVFIFLYGIRVGNWSGSKIKKTLKIIGVLIIISSVISYVNYESISNRNFVKTDFGYNYIQHILIIFSSYGDYIVKIFKGPYTFFYPIDNAQNFNYNYYIFLSLITVSLVLVMLYQFIVKQKNHLFAILWYFLALFQTSMLVCLVSDFPFNVAGRYFTMASPGIFLFGLIMLDKYFKKYFNYCVILFSFYFLVNTANQIQLYKDEKTLVDHNLKVNPTEEILNQMSIKAFFNNDTLEAYTLLEKSERLNRNIKFNHPFFYYLDLALIYQSQNDSLKTKKLLKESFQLDIDFKHPKNDIRILDQVVDQLYPLNLDRETNRETYLKLRDRLIRETGSTQKKNRI